MFEIREIVKKEAPGVISSIVGGFREFATAVTTYATKHIGAIVVIGIILGAMALVGFKFDKFIDYIKGFVAMVKKLVKDFIEWVKSLAAKQDSIDNTETNNDEVENFNIVVEQ